MDINFLKAELTNMVDRESDFVQQRLHKLLERLDNEIEVKNTATSVISDVLATVENYNQTYLTLVAEYSAIETAKVKERINKIHEILCTLSALSTYLVSSCAQYLTGNVEASITIAKHLRVLEIKRDYFSSEKIVWQSLLKSLTQGQAKETELLRYRTMQLRNEIVIKENE